MDQEQLKKWLAIGSLIVAGLGGVWVTNKGELPNIIPPAVVVPPAPQMEENPAGITVNVPETVKIGELVILDTEGSDSDTFAWRVLPHTKNFAVIDDGARAVFSQEHPGECIFIVSALVDDEVKIAAYKTTVGRGNVVPNPIVPGTSVSGQVSSLLAQMSADPGECKSLRRSFNTVLLGMQSGLLKESESIKAAQKTATALALATNTARWAPFKEQLRQMLNGIRDQGGLETVDQHMVVWAEIIAGISAYLGE